MKKPNSKLRYDYFQKIFKKFHDNKPKVPPLNNYSTSKRIYHARYDTENKDNNEDDQRSEDEKAFSESYLSQFLQIDDEELESMTESHAKLLSSLDDTPPEGIYSGNGIVFVGGGSFNWLTLLSVKSIRALGSEMPIEILIPKLDEYELDICARIFPALSARCIYLPYALSDPDASDSEAEADIISKFEFKGYQYKALAILLSSFENVLLLDSDNIPVHRPDYLFSSEPFTNNGLIVWPDFWRRATSPYYYKIAGIPISKTEVLPKYDEVNGAYVPYDAPPYEGGDDHEHLNLDRIPLHQRKGAIPDPTSESGQLMISKSTHSKALHLALYYNLYGPNYFYPLFSQGSDGEGDKETFLAATVAVGKPFYQVAKFLNAFGYFNSKNEFEGTGMGQYDPVEDYEYNQQRQLYQNNLKQWEVLKTKDHLLKNGPRILFVHANFPKLNPWKLKSEKKIIDSKGNRLRLYGTGMKVRTGYDFEFVQWSNMKFLLCDLKIELITFKGVDRVDLCKEIHEHLLFLKSTMSSME
ncbi:mannosyltransferase putative-domain-containing protein [Scheffersomyces amazonensis]|uniref:mannosyltransferase putative-domain-containing protein n=1 Tax=Scheffersomyces amazonensis TaxID=1078765 RepID=UPI00315DE035